MKNGSNQFFFRRVVTIAVLNRSDRTAIELV